MRFPPTPLERAFELARSGECADVAAIRDRLRKEGHSLHHLTGPSLLKQLRELCQAAPRPEPSAGPDPDSGQEPQA